MHKLALIACVAFLFGAAPAVEKTAPAQLEEKMPKQADLKISDGTDEGYKTPVEVMARAIKAAKDSKLADIKACLSKEARPRVDEKSFHGDGNTTKLKEISLALAAYSAEGLTAIKQNTVGNYAVVICTSTLGRHLVRTTLESQDLPAKEGEEAKPGPKNWYISAYEPQDFDINVDTPQVKEIIDVINKGDAAKLKEFLETYETYGLPFLSGAKEGVDAYELLALRLKKIINNGNGKPVLLMNKYSSEVAFWFAGDAGDTFIVLKFWIPWDAKKKATSVQISFGCTAEFFCRTAGQYRGWAEDWER